VEYSEPYYLFVLKNPLRITMYDVIVSGAGPSGSRCAEVVAKAGYKVALIEKDIHYRKPCGGGVPRASIYKYYPQLKKVDLHEIHGISLCSADYHKVEYIYQNLAVYPKTVDRLEFDNILREIAVEAGAEIFDKNTSIDFITEKGRKVGIQTKTASGLKNYHGEIVIIADGMSSKLAPRSGLRGKWKIEQLGLGRAAILEGKSNLDPQMTYFYFKPYGYSWIFPLSEKRFNIGSITYFENNLKYNVNTAFKEFLVDLQEKGLLTETSYREIWSANFPEPASGVLEKNLSGDNIILVGDAGGFVAPISGEGIHAAIVTGNIAGETCIEALEKEDYSAKMLKKFTKHPTIKKIIRTFKFQRGFVNFFYEKEGENLNKLFRLAEKDENFKQDVINTFIMGMTPPKDFLLRIKNSN